MFSPIRPLPLVCLIALTACSGSDRQVTPGSDAGSTTDGGTLTDGGQSPDGGSNPDGGSTTDGGSVSESAFPAVFAEAICSRVFDCCTLAEVQANFGENITDEASCRTMEAGFAGQFTAVKNASRQRFDEQAAGQCASFAGSAACHAFALSQPAGSEVCNQIIVGLQQSGSPCASAQECVTGFCAGIPLDNNGDPSGDGTCRNTVAAGNACLVSSDPDKFNDGDPCQAGAFETWMAGHCTCETKLASNEVCEGSSDCASGYCNDSNRCADPSTAPEVCTATAP